MTRWSLRRHRHRAQRPVTGTVRLDPARPELEPAPGGYRPENFRPDGYAPAVPGAFHPGPPGAPPPGNSYPGTSHPAGPQQGYPQAGNAPQGYPQSGFPQTAFTQRGVQDTIVEPIPAAPPGAGPQAGFPQPGAPLPDSLLGGGFGGLAGTPATAGGAWPEVMERFGLQLLTLAEQLRTSLDELESDEADPERLQRLYKVDHAVTRMRRVSLDLRTLAGRSEDALSGIDTSILDVIRMALSAIERYTQVTIGKVTEFAVLGYAADDVAALLAALLDNATRYSPGATTVSAHLTEAGSVLLRIEDSGIGMAADGVSALNAMLAGDVPPLDDRTGRHTGFPVVHRIARKHSIGVRLAARGGRSSGMIALVTVPPELMCELPDDVRDLQPPPPPRGREGSVSVLPTPRREPDAPPAGPDYGPEDGVPGDFPVRVPGATMHAARSGSSRPGTSGAGAAMAGRRAAEAAAKPGGAPEAVPDGGDNETPAGLPRREPGSLRGDRADNDAGPSISLLAADSGLAPDRSEEEQSAARRAFADDLAAFSLGSQGAPAPAPQDPSGKGNPS